jgi:flagellar export protein FliJ
LQVVLEQRRRLERDALGVLAMAQNERASVEAELAELRGVVEAERDVARGLMLGRVSARSLREHVAGELGADRRARALAVKLAGVQKRVDRARELLRRASVQREAIEKLRERRYRAWVDELEKAERLELDDLFVMRRGHGEAVEG